MPLPALLITGAAGGMGRTCANHLASVGWKVFAAVHNSRDLIAFEGGNVIPLTLDITSDDQIRSAVSFVQQKLAGSQFRGLINNAAVCVTGPLEHISRQLLREQFEVNVISHLSVTQAFLPLLRQASGRIVNIGSISGHISGAWFGPYCASKFALEAITVALRAELRTSGVHVSIVDPGTMSTRLWDQALQTQGKVLGNLNESERVVYATQLTHRRAQMQHARDSGLSPNAACEAVAHALTARTPRDRYISGARTRAKIALARYMPEVAWRAIARIRERRHA